MSFWDKVPVIGSVRKCNKAERIVKYAEEDHYEAKKSLRHAQNTSEERVEELFDLKTSCAVDALPKALDALERCQKINRLETSVHHDVYERFSHNSRPSLKQQSITIEGIVSSGAKGTSAGSALALGSMSLVASFGAASTGTAITSLSGVAATNATMAWFGGGALSAGGAGMAGGAAVLGGIAIAPLVVLGAFKFASHAEEKLTSARVFVDEVEVIVEKINSAVAFANELNNHVKQFIDILGGLIQRLSTQVQRLNTLLDNDDEAVVQTKLQIILLIKAIKRLLEIELFNEEQKPSEASLKIIDHVVNTREEESEKFIAEVALEEEIELPTGVVYLQDIAVGEDSPKYFWLQDDYYENQEDEKKHKTSVKCTADSELELSFFAILVITVVFLSIAYWTYLEFDLELIPYILIFFPLSLCFIKFKEVIQASENTLGCLLLFSILGLTVDYFYYGELLKYLEGFFSLFGL